MNPPLLIWRKSLADEVFTTPRELLVLRLTAVLLLLHGAHSWTLDVPLRIACGLMLIFPTLLASSLMWLAVCVSLILGNALDWTWIDNHKYLITYWSMVCTLAVVAKKPDAVLSWNARLLLGLVFLFAVIWKVLAGEYVDGSFLHFVFLTDRRVEVPARIVGGLETYVLPVNRLVVLALKELPHIGIQMTLETSSLLRVTALWASYWALLIEGVVALAFLLPTRVRLSQSVRDFSLILFIGTTYFLLPVTGFAFIITVMGFAQCPQERPRTRLVYIGVFVLVQLTRVPWQQFVS